MASAYGTNSWHIFMETHAKTSDEVSYLALEILSLMDLAGKEERPFFIRISSPHFQTYWLLRTFLNLPSFPSVSLTCHQGLQSEYLIEVCRRDWPPT